MILMWLMGFWAHWYMTLLNKQKVTRQLFELSQEYEKEALAKVWRTSCDGYKHIGKAEAYVDSARIVSENL